MHSFNIFGSLDYLLGPPVLPMSLVLGAPLRSKFAVALGPYWLPYPQKIAHYPIPQSPPVPGMMVLLLSYLLNGAVSL